MELLHALGINAYSIIQFFIFVCTFSALIVFVFNPYAEALEQRNQRTKGGEELAEDYQKKTVELQSEYQEKARAVNGEISAIFQKKRAEAVAEQNKKIADAKAEATAAIEKNRGALRASAATATAELQGQVSSMALLITNKLLGK